MDTHEIKLNKTTLFLFSLFLGLFISQVKASTVVEHGEISGRVTVEGKTSSSLVNLTLKEINKITTTDDKGYYQFRHIPIGTYTLEVSYVGLITQIVKVQVTTGKTIHINFNLKPDSHELTEIQVIGKKNNLFNSTKASPSLGLGLQAPLLRISQNIQIVNRAMINQQQLFSTDEGIGRNVSGIRTIMHNPTFASVYIRGFTTNYGSLRNGMSIGNYFGPLKEDLSFVDCIEFVKGPAIFMMGNTEPGGFYNVVTKKPTGINQTEARLTSGSFDTYRAELDFDRILKNNKLLFRFNIMGQLRGSHVEYTPSRGIAIAPTLTYLVNKNTSITIEYTNQHHQLSSPGPYVYSKKGFKDAPVRMSYNDPNTTQLLTANDHSAFVTASHTFNPSWKLTGQAAYLVYKIRGMYLYPTYNSLDDQGNMTRNFQLHDVDNNSKLGQLFINGNFKTGTISHQLLSGLDLGDKKYFADWSNIPTSSFAFNIYQPEYGHLSSSKFPKVRTQALEERASNQGSYSYSALYIQDELSFLNNKIKWTVGGRLTRTNKADKNTDKINHVFVPRTGLNVAITKNIALYAIYDKTFQEQTKKLTNGKIADPSRGTNIELGLKKDWMNGKWSTTLATYWITKTNLVTSAGPSNPGLFLMSGEALSRGVEFDLTGEILPQLNLILNYAYIDAKITKGDQKGAGLSGVAKHTTNTWATYSLSKGKLAGLGFSIGAQLQTERTSYFGTHKLPDDWFRLDAGISYSKNEYLISLLVNNLTNHYNYVGFYPGEGQWKYNHYGWQTDAPTNFKLSVGYKF